ncbi:MAG: hypothetical protein EOO20_09205 [Chryseobacterium sp.]|nr:MAG: hypothetical protein EOO20_09205 [Chryseobacterium sp.]
MLYAFIRRFINDHIRIRQAYPRQKSYNHLEGNFPCPQGTGNIKYALYAVKDFFVEVSYETNGNSILDFHASKTNRLLDYYIKEIKLEI